jgi:RNase adaptor protein for sRNA GlmZ degradation
MSTVVKEQEKSTIEKLREIRDKVSAETQNMNFQELKKYVEQQLQESLFPQSVWI